MQMILSDITVLLVILEALCLINTQQLLFLVVWVFDLQWVDLCSSCMPTLREEDSKHERTGNLCTIQKYWTNKG
jgi:hypothetical protein